MMATFLSFPGNDSHLASKAISQKDYPDHRVSKTMGLSESRAAGLESQEGQNEQSQGCRGIFKAMGVELKAPNQ